MTKHQLVFVIGCPRSGTTLVQCLLSAHSQGYSLPETHFFSQILPELHLESNIRLNGSKLKRLVADLKSVSGISLSSKLSKKIELDCQRSVLTPKRLFHLLLESFQPRNKVTHFVVEKTPFHALHLNELTRLFPEAKFVAIVRHPVEVLGSWKQTPFFPGSLTKAISVWNRISGEINGFSHKYPRKIKVIKYENLASQTSSGVQELTEFLNITYESSMLKLYPNELAKNTLENEKWKRKVSNKISPRTRKSNSLAWWELVLINFLTISTRDFFHYPAKL